MQLSDEQAWREACHFAFWNRWPRRLCRTGLSVLGVLLSAVLTYPLQDAIGLNTQPGRKSEANHNTTVENPLALVWAACAWVQNHSQMTNERSAAAHDTETENLRGATGLQPERTRLGNWVRDSQGRLWVLDGDQSGWRAQP